MTTSRIVSRNSSQKGCRRTRTAWTAWLSVALLVTLPALTMAAPAGLAAGTAAEISHLEKRAIQYMAESEPEMELTVEANESYYVEHLKQDECVNTFSVPPAKPGTTAAFKYDALTASESNMVVNFYMDDQCQEYEFSIVSEVPQFSGYFASVKYVGEFSDVKPGVYDKEEISRTVLPGKEPLPDTIKFDKPAGGGGGGGGNGNAPLTSNDAPTVSNPRSPGFYIGVGIIGTVTVAGILAMGVFTYQKQTGKRRDGQFMTLSADDDENGPHSSALMQSRADASFDDERLQAGYRDENASDDEVELNGYPQKSEPGTLPQK